MPVRSRQEVVGCVAEWFKVSVLKAGVQLYHRFESCRILFYNVGLFLKFFLSLKMVITFFALRPMFTAVDRLLVDREASLLGLSISYFSRRKALKSAGLYNTFGLTSTLDRYDSVRKFATLHAFLLMAAFVNGRLTSLGFVQSVYAFSLLSFYPIGLLGVSTRFCIAALLSVFRLSVLIVKSRPWLL
jgi:hypothetical protein